MLAAVTSAAARAAALPSPSASRSAAASAVASAAASARARPTSALPRRADARRQHQTDDDHRQHDDADTSPLGTCHRSTRMTEVACKSGSGNRTPTKGRSVTDV